MNEKEFCFIICSNNDFYLGECLHYIRSLIVPDGYSVDVLTVSGAKSMTAGYNEAMECSKAKYKVYLHQDTFIINPHFIRDCLEVFLSDERIGMLGNIGAKKLPDSGIMWETDRNGMVYEQHIYETVLAGKRKADNGNEVIDVEVVDGFLMVTQYDIRWREDLFDQWDFYDCSQSMEFTRKGYRVVVPIMTVPWCVHDCGFVNLERYDDERKKFVEEYL